MFRVPLVPAPYHDDLRLLRLVFILFYFILRFLFLHFDYNHRARHFTQGAMTLSFQNDKSAWHANDGYY